MAVGTRPPAATPANRLPRSAAPVNRGHEIRVGALGVLGLVLLVVAVPVALAAFVGYPLPTSAPSHRWLTQSVSATLIIKALACIVWVVWAHFTVCLISEWRAIRRGRLPSQIALGGGSQLLARRLVAAALLLSGAATAFAPTASNSPGSHRPAATAGAAAGTRAIAAIDKAFGESVAVVQTDAGPAAAPSSRTGETKYYVVHPPRGQRYDCLWDIAERTLHDPRRYKEIFELNKDRVQSDGRKLVDANLILPGWQLRLPADASGPGVHTAHASVPGQGPRPGGVTERPAAAGSDTVRPGTAQPDAAQSGAAWSSTPAVTHAAAPAADDGADTSLLLGGALMLAGLAVAVSARRGPYAPDEDDALHGGDPELARLLDRALRSLAAARAEQGRDLPHPVAAWVSAEQLTLNLAGGDVEHPPAPWQPGDVARSWTVAVSQLADEPSADVAAPFPGLLSVGREQGFELFVDFEQAPGPISLGGDLGLARQVATALAVQAATGLWSDGARVTLVGFGDGAELARIEPRAVSQVPQLRDVLAAVEGEHEELLRVQRQLGVDGVLTGRQARRSPVWQPHLLVLSGPPTPEEAARLQALASGRSNTIVVVVGDLPAARWRFVVDGDARIDLGVLGAVATAHRLDRDAVVRLGEIVAGADEVRRTSARDVAMLEPAGASGRAAGPSLPPRSGRIAATVGVLGPVAVDATGPVDPAKRARLTEIVVAVALRPDGVHEDVLRAEIWPRGAEPDVVAAAMADAAAWLGTDASGRPCLYENAGRWYVSPDVALDWHELLRLTAAAGPDDLDTLLRAVVLFRGEAFSATPAGQYHWLAFAGAAREAKVLGTTVARSAAALLTQRFREDDAEQVLRRGLDLVPASELLWRDLLALVGGRGPDDAGAVAAEMYETLHRCRAWAEPETDALVAQVAPGYERPRTA